MDTMRLLLLLVLTLCVLKNVQGQRARRARCKRPSEAL